MDKERLQVLPFEALQDLARRSGLKRTDELEKDFLIDQILEVIEEDRFDRERSNNIEMLVKEKKFELNPNDSLEYPGINERSLPKTYNETRIVLMLRDPSWAYTYWDLEPKSAKLAASEDDSDRFILRVWETNIDNAIAEKLHYDIPLKGSERSWYVNLPRTGRSYFVELIYTIDRLTRIAANRSVGRISEQTDDASASRHAEAQKTSSSKPGEPDSASTAEENEVVTDYQRARNPHIPLVSSNERILCRSNTILSPHASLDDFDLRDELGYANILSVAGLRDIEEASGNGAIPQRIISLLDTQYLHLKG